MSDKSAIEWTDATWNPVRGCSKVSAGCAHCYAEIFAERWRGIPGHPYEQGFDLRLIPEKVEEPLHWKRPRRVFVNSMSDLFQEGVPIWFIKDVFKTMKTADWHTFQVLTKRPGRMREVISKYLKWVPDAGHIWIGVSVENRKQGVPRIKELRNTPAAVRFLSIEPLLEDIGTINLEGIHWVIVGGESGPHARLMKEEWVLSIRDQCKAAKVPFFFKQSYTYDENGNLLSDGIRTFEWDEENRLISVTKGNHRTEFVYDGLGRRVQILEKDIATDQTTTTTSERKFLWAGTEIAEERSGDDGGMVQKRFFAQGFVDSDGTILLYTRDHLGSIRELVDMNQVVRARYEYDPYGNVTKVSGDRDSDFLYTGHYWHQQSGLFLTLYRAYDPELGRWISRDPIGEAGGINIYAYVQNAPTAYVDRLGLDITVTGHPVVPGVWHAGIRITVGPESQFYWDSRFFNQDSQGNHYAELSAGPEGIFPKLTKSINRYTDISPQDYESKPLDIGKDCSEDQMIQKLLDAFGRYRNNRKYGFFPDNDENGNLYDHYNSNGFVSGLLGSVGLPTPSLPYNFPGIDKPVPAGDFK